MGSVRSDHDGQRRGSPQAAATSPRSLCLGCLACVLRHRADPPPRPPRAQRRGDAPALPAARRRGASKGGDPRRAAGPRCTARPGVGVPRSRLPRGGGWGATWAAATCDRWLLRLRETAALPAPGPPMGRSGGRRAGVCTGTDVNVYIFFIQQMPINGCCLSVSLETH